MSDSRAHRVLTMMAAALVALAAACGGKRSAADNVVAVDLANPTGPLKFVYEPHPDPRSVGIACCDVVNRGASFADGKIIYNLLDAHTVAVDAETGKEVWRTKVGDINIGETITS